MDTDIQYMQRCIELAAHGLANVAPNPMVGAVLVHHNRIIGEGYHRAFGQAHAEVNCFDSVAEADRSLIPASTMYVSLEPCAHYGKTPPCALRIAAEKVRKVVVACVDPFAEVGGKGLDILHENGVEVQVGCLEKEAQFLNRRFFTFHKYERPYIILKWAQSADAYIAPGPGQKLQLSNSYAQHLVHKWRTEEAAILVGRQTAATDNPRLNARLWKGKDPLRIVIDPELKLDKSLHLFDKEIKTWVLNHKEANEEPMLLYKKVPQGTDVLHYLMEALYKEGINSLIVEGGTATLSQFIIQNLWDEARVFDTPVVLGKGIAAPVLQNVSSVERIALENNQLSLYYNNHLS